jgi:hypothetical protein
MPDEQPTANGPDSAAVAAVARAGGPANPESAHSPIIDKLSDDGGSTSRDRLVVGVEFGRASRSSAR